jgi:hypothetical protein
MHYGPCAARLAKLIGTTTAAAVFAAASAHASVTISSGATENMSCSAGVCAPTAAKSVLNAGDLETLLASGSVIVTTSGQSVQAKDINVKAAITWSSDGELTLDAWKSIAVDQPVAVSGAAALTLTTDDGGRNGVLSFDDKGRISFANLSSPLTINGVSYTIVGDLETLASDIALDPGGYFALADDYDASGSGSYAIKTTFNGTFEGLGNVISNFTFVSKDLDMGLFEEVGGGGVLRDIGLNKAKVSGRILHRKRVIFIGVLAGDNAGVILHCYATGTVSDLNPAIAGGLAGSNEGTIARSHAAVDVSSSDGFYGDAGGLVGQNTSTISESYASGTVSGKAWAGGLLYDNEGTVMDSYATGNVDGNIDGGLAALNGGYFNNQGAISTSYATGRVAARSYSGGLIGDDGAPPGSLVSTYWDTDTSGITNLSQGAGNVSNDPGITGLTTSQFQSGLPAGFDPKIWAEKSNVNGGLPYLISNPPP